MVRSNRIHRIALCWVFVLGSLGVAHGQERQNRRGAGSDLTLWYKQSAAAWVEALPVGNGRLGAMVFGDVQHERIQLNEDTLWAGHPVERNRVGAHEHLNEARRLIFEGQYAEGQAIVQNELMGERIAPRSYQTLGDLELDIETDAKIEEYSRWLHLDTATAGTEYRAGGARFKRDVFASPVDQAVVVRFVCDKPGQITLNARLSREENASVETVGYDGLVMRGQADRGEKHEGVEFEARLKAVVLGGKVAASDKGLRIEKADRVTFYITAGTSYRGGDYSQRCQEQLAAAQKKSYREFRRSHIQEHRRLFRRVELDLGTSEAEKLPTDERLNAVKEGAVDPQLLALYFQYGRYLLLCSSRPGCMPANL